MPEHKKRRGSTAVTDSPLAVVLTAPVKVCSVDESVPVRVEVRNISGSPLWMVGVLDGSEAGVRYPHYTPRITGPGYRPRAPERPEFTSPLRPQDFRLLNPSESFDPTVPLAGTAYVPLVAFSEFRPQTPGRYELSLILSTDCDKDEEWLGTLPYAQDEALPLIARIPRAKVESNLLVIDVR